MTAISDKALDAARKVLGKCAANDPWFPQPNDATAYAWGEQFMICNLPVDDLLAGVTRVYASHGSGFRPLPADVIAAAREVRRDRAQRRSDEELAGRDAVIDRKAADDVAELAAAFIPGKVKPTKRLKAARAALQTVEDRATAVVAIREYFAAKKAASK